jgi:phage-related protein
LELIFGDLANQLGGTLVRVVDKGEQLPRRLGRLWARFPIEPLERPRPVHHGPIEVNDDVAEAPLVYSFMSVADLLIGQIAADADQLTLHHVVVDKEKLPRFHDGTSDPGPSVPVTDGGSNHRREQGGPPGISLLISLSGMAWALEFYRTASGRAPVEDYLDDLTPTEAAKAARGLDLLRTFGTELGMPHVRPLGGGLYEFRLRGQREHRVVYVALAGQRFLLLHAFTKKTQRTPKAEVALAEQRYEDYLRRREKPHG